MKSENRTLLLFPAVLLAAIVVLAGLAFWELSAFTEGIRQETLSNIQEEGELIRRLVQPLLEEGRIDDARNLCNTFDRESLRITLIGDDGRVEADSSRQADELPNHLMREEVASALAGHPEAVTRQSESTGRWMTYHATVVEANGRKYILRTAVNTHRTESLSRLVRGAIWTALGLGITAFLVLLAYILWRIKGPLAALQASMDRIAEGDLEAQIPVPSHGMVKPIARNVQGMTERLRSQLHKLQKMETFRRDFLSNVSHEIKTPLTAIIVAAETIQQTSDLPKEQFDKLVALMCAQSQRLNSLVQDILALSSLEHRQGEQRSEFYSFRLSDAVEEAVNECRDVANRQGCDVTLVDSPSVCVLGDAQLLTQAISNLISNALKYSGSQSVTLAVSRVGDRAVVACIDHGCGIPREHWPRIFERFYRINKERSRSLGGTGLGLAIVKHIMQLHRGSVEIDETPGGGTTFRLTLPAL